MGAMDGRESGAGGRGGYRSRGPGEISPGEWDLFVARTSGGTFRQTSAWLSLKAIQGWRTHTVAVSGPENELVGGANLLIKPLPGVPRAGQIGYCAKGPLLASADPALRDLVLDEVARTCRSLRVRMLIIQPPEDAPSLDAALSERGCTPSPLAVAPEATAVVRLSRELAESGAGLSKNHRRNIRKGERHGVRVRLGGEADLAQFQHLHVASANRLGYQHFPAAYYRRMWELFAPEDRVKLFLAEHEGEVVAALVCLIHRDTIHRMALGWSVDHRGVFANDVLDWETIRWAVGRGLRFYDLENINRDVAARMRQAESPAVLPVSGSDAYKLKWTSDVVVFPSPQLFVASGVGRRLLSVVPSSLVESSFRSMRARFRPMASP